MRVNLNLEEDELQGATSQATGLKYSYGIFDPDSLGSLGTWLARLMQFYFKP